MSYKHTLTATIKADESTHKQLEQLYSVSKSILIVERKNGFTKIYSESGVQYTTEDIIRKGL